MCCPNGNQLVQARRWPKIAEQYKRTCVKAYKVRLEKGLKTTWKSGEEMFYWWISGAPGHKEKDDPQERFFFE